MKTEGVTEENLMINYQMYHLSQGESRKKWMEQMENFMQFFLVML